MLLLYSYYTVIAMVGQRRLNRVASLVETKRCNNMAEVPAGVNPKELSYMKMETLVSESLSTTPTKLPHHCDHLANIQGAFLSQGYE